MTLNFEFWIDVALLHIVSIDNDKSMLTLPVAFFGSRENHGPTTIVAAAAAVMTAATAVIVKAARLIIQRLYICKNAKETY